MGASLLSCLSNLETPWLGFCSAAQGLSTSESWDSFPQNPSCCQTLPKPPGGTVVRERARVQSNSIKEAGHTSVLPCEDRVKQPARSCTCRHWQPRAGVQVSQLRSCFALHVPGLAFMLSARLCERVRVCRTDVREKLNFGERNTFRNMEI